MNADDETQSVPGEPQAPNGAADDAGPTQSRRGFFRPGVGGGFECDPTSITRSNESSHSPTTSRPSARSSYGSC